MKYRVDLSRHQALRVDVEAANVDEAVKLAEQANTGFRVDGLAELIDDRVPGAEWQPASRCETCSKVIWVGEPCVNAGEDADLCMACANTAVQPGGVAA